MHKNGYFKRTLQKAGGEKAKKVVEQLKEKEKLAKKLPEGFEEFENLMENYLINQNRPGGGFSWRSVVENILTTF